MKFPIKFLSNVLFIYVFILSHTFCFSSYAQNYQKDAEDFTAGQNEDVKILAQNAVALSFMNLNKDIFYERFSPKILKESSDIINSNVEKINKSISDSTGIVYEAKIGHFQDKTFKSKIHQALKATAQIDAQIKELSWYIRDHMDHLISSSDWVLASLRAFQDRCDLGFYISSNKIKDIEAEEPEDFKFDVDIYFGYSQGFGVEESSGNHKLGFSIYPENYASDKTLKSLTNTSEILADTYVLAQVGQIVANALASQLDSSTLGSVGDVLGTTATSIGVAAVALAIITLIVGSHKAYKKKKKWAKAEVYKFKHSLDSDDFSRIYREECQKSIPKIKIFTDIFDKYNSDIQYRSNIKNALAKSSFNTCEEFINFKELNNPKANFTETTAEDLLKYYQCTTQKYNDSLLTILSNELSLISQKTEELRVYLNNVLYISQDFTSEYIDLIGATEKEIEIDRLHKELMIITMGIIVGQSSPEYYNYKKSELIEKLSAFNEESYFFKKSRVQESIERSDLFVFKYTKGKGA